MQREATPCQELETANKLTVKIWRQFEFITPSPATQCDEKLLLFKAEALKR